jgi:hypothetical protein
MLIIVKYTFQNLFPEQDPSYFAAARFSFPSSVICLEYNAGHNIVGVAKRHIVFNS